MIANREQFEAALSQLASFRGLMQAMRRHLKETEPALIPTATESYRHRIQELQDQICDYLLRERADSRDDDVADQRVAASIATADLPL